MRTVKKFPTKTPVWLQKLYRGSLWKIPSKDKAIYLTFDDGPIPEITDFVLATLKQFSAKATFFTVGKNLEKYPELKQQYIKDGHLLGNHTENHNHGWLTSCEEYIASVKAFSEHTSSELFRPPYGKITPAQYRRVKQKYTVVFWDVLSRDYDKAVSPEECLAYSLQADKGSIVVFHENIKAQKNLEYALPKFLEHYSTQGYVFKTLKGL